MAARADNLRILVIEDARYYATMLKKRIKSVLGYDAVLTYSYAGAKELLQTDTDYFLALVDLVLPDSEDGGILDLVISKDISPIVITGNYDDALREKILSKKKVIDYIFKQEAQFFKVTTDLIGKIVRNQDIKILIAEDSPPQRLKLKKLLETQKYQVLEAADGAAAFRIAEANPDIKLVLTDYNMPVVDGFDLVKMLRKIYDKDQLTIIGISAEGSSGLSAKFLKLGANDFLTKPYAAEELVARITQNLEMLDMVETLKNLSIKDPLTKLYNRRYFFEEGEKKFKESNEKNMPLTVAMIDIDYFKKINDVYGHDGGDAALKMISGLLVETTRVADIVSRFGGEEFCVMASETDETGAKFLFEKIRSRIEETVIYYEEQTIKLTASIGIACGRFNTLDDTIRHADKMLYIAKAEGRNRVVSKQTED